MHAFVKSRIIFVIRPIIFAFILLLHLSLFSNQSLSSHLESHVHSQENIAGDNVDASAAEQQSLARQSRCVACIGLETDCDVLRESWLVE